MEEEEEEEEEEVRKGGKRNIESRSLRIYAEKFHVPNLHSNKIFVSFSEMKFLLFRKSLNLRVFFFLQNLFPFRS